jgi:hypothetical protein
LAKTKVNKTFVRDVFIAAVMDRNSSNEKPNLAKPCVFALAYPGRLLEELMKILPVKGLPAQVVGVRYRRSDLR